MKDGYTHIHVLLDRSGSMATIANDVSAGMDAFIKRQAAVPGRCTFSFVQFDHEYQTVIEWADLRAVGPIAFEPRGSTALLDAFGRSVEWLGRKLAALPEGERPSKVIFVVQTDGMENASREYTREKVRALVKRQSDEYAWDFVFLGANMDAFGEAATFGVSVMSASAWLPTAAGVQAVYCNTADAVARARVTGSAFGYTQAEQTANATGQVVSGGTLSQSSSSIPTSP